MVLNPELVYLKPPTLCQVEYSPYGTGRNFRRRGVQYTSASGPLSS